MIYRVTPVARRDPSPALPQPTFSPFLGLPLGGASRFRSVTITMIITSMTITIMIIITIINIYKDTILRILWEPSGPGIRNIATIYVTASIQCISTIYVITTIYCIATIYFIATEVCGLDPTIADRRGRSGGKVQSWGHSGMSCGNLSRMFVGPCLRWGSNRRAVDCFNMKMPCLSALPFKA